MSMIPMRVPMLWIYIVLCAADFVPIQDTILLPQPRTRFTASYLSDPCLGDRVVIFGGQNTLTTMLDLWEISLNVISLFPTSATGSEEYGSSWPKYSYWAATGEFDTPDWIKCGDVGTNWAPKTGGNQWLEVRYSRALKPSSFSVHETLAAPFISSVSWGNDSSNLKPVSMAGKDGTTCPGYYNLPCQSESYMVDRIRLDTTTPIMRYPEIDSVEFKGLQDGVMMGQQLFPTPASPAQSSPIIALTDLGSTGVGDKFVVWGGMDQYLAWNNNAYMYDVGTSSWTVLPPPPASVVGRNGISMLYLCGAAWIFFGNSINSLVDGSAILVLDAFSPTVRWNSATLPGMPQIDFPSPRRAVASTVQSDGISEIAWFYGGLTTDAYMGGFANDLWSFTPTCGASTGIWKLVQPTGARPVALRGANLNFYNGSLWLFNGSPPNGTQPFSAMYMYSIATNQWSVLEAMKSPMKYATGLKHQSFVLQTPTVAESGIFLIGPEILTDVAANFDNADASATNIYLYSFSKNEWINLLRPPARSFHTSVTFNGDTYIFGGISDQLGFLQDLWKLSAENKWKKIAAGSPPSPRYGHCAAEIDGKMYIFGGNSTGGLVMDLYTIDLANPAVWVRIEYTSPAPAPRFLHTCVVVITYYFSIVTFGGFGVGGALNDLNFYFPRSQDWFQVTQQHPYVHNLPEDLAKKYPASSAWPSARGGHTAFVLYQPYLHMIVTGGSTKSDFSDWVDSAWQYRFSFTKQNWTRIYGENIVQSLGAPLPQLPGASVVASGDQWLYFGGAYFQSLTKTPSLSAFLTQVTPTGDYAAETLTPATAPSTHLGSVDRGRIGHTMVLKGSTLSFFGGKTRLKELNDIIEFSIGNPCSTEMAKNDSSCFRCPPGSFYTQNSCQVCGIGSFNDATGATLCKLCSDGFVNKKTGSVLEQECEPCPAGYWNPNNSNNCTRCNSDEICLVTLKKPLDRAALMRNNTSLASQPTSEVERDIAKNALVSLVLYCIGGGLFLVSVLLMFSLRNNGGVQRFMSKIDLFQSAHKERPIVVTADGRKAEVSVSQSTPLGGFLAILWLIAVIIVIGTFITQYALLNALETRSLLPTALATSVLVGGFNASVTVHGWKPDCLNLSTPTGCYGGLLPVVSDIGLNKTQSYFCEEGTDENNLKFCTIHWRCVDCNITQPSSQISFQFGLYEGIKNAWAAMISYKISSDSGIPGQISEVKGAFVSSTGEIFRGVGAATVSSIDMTPTFYNNTISKTSLTGYHVAESGRTFGQLTGSENFKFVNGVWFNFTLSQTPSYLQVYVQPKLTPLQFLSGAMALVSGLMGSFAFLLGVLEFCHHMFETKVQKKQVKAAFGQLAVNVSDFELTGVPTVNKLISMELSSDTPCFACGRTIPQGSKALWERGRGTFHTACGSF